MVKTRRITVQGVNKETWGLLAGLARMRGITIGEYLTELIRREADRLLKAEVGEEREDKDDKDGGDPENLP